MRQASTDASGTAICVPGESGASTAGPERLQRSGAGFSPTWFARGSIAVAAVLAASVRLVGAVRAAQRDDPDPLAAYGFTVVFPLVLACALLLLGPGRTREGVLMRLGTACQLLLVAAVPRFSLHLLLGLPVVFLLAELFETRLPRALREPVERLLVRC